MMQKWRGIGHWIEGQEDGGESEEMWGACQACGNSGKEYDSHV